MTIRLSRSDQRIHVGYTMMREPILYALIGQSDVGYVSISNSRCSFKSS